MLRRLRTLSERECYVRCYGAGDEAVRVLRVGAGEEGAPVTHPVRARATLAAPAHLSGEQLRRLFEERLERREPRAA